MEHKPQAGFLTALKRELIPALGCTEPIAVAYAAAKARAVLGCLPERIHLCCSGNIVKNVKSVTVPHSGGMRGLDAAAVLGVVGGDADRALEVLEGITPEHIAMCRKLLEGDFFSCSVKEGVEKLYIDAAVSAGGHSARVTIANCHTRITHISRDGATLFHLDETVEEDTILWDRWSVAGILAFARETELAEIRPILDEQVRLNTAISDEGLSGRYGAAIGRTLLDIYGSGVDVRARARAAAGSDARMGGCSLPVVINSGSGNQGMTASLPVIEYAAEWSVPAETLYRALLVSNLISIYIKHEIGSLSAFCGAVTAACGAGAAITFMAGGGDGQIAWCIANTLGNVSGIVCDGAKASCAAKIASAIDAALLGFHMSMRGCSFQAGEGIVAGDIDSTIKNIGHIGRVGMERTDTEIIALMLGKTHP